MTSAVCALFTRFEDDAGHGEVDEAARGHGLRRALGELLVCPDCLSPRVAGGSWSGTTKASSSIATCMPSSCWNQPSGDR